MIRSYSNIELTTGFYTAGICRIKIAPREWLENDIEINFNTGQVKSAVALLDDQEWLELELADNTYEFEEKPKTGKAGPYYDVTIQGLVNNLTPELQITLETLRNHDFVALVYDKQKRWKFVGTKECGLTFTFGDKQDNLKQQIPIDLTYQSITSAPFYPF